ncbi:MAG: hypothetical protein D6701_05795, partial [Gemmatimonadetes bacterium]
EVDEATRRAAAERAEAERAVAAAREALDAQAAAYRAADEAQRLVARRFAEGLATTLDLLQAQARAAAFRTAWVDARAELAVARARLAFARGGATPATDDPTHSTNGHGR